MLAMLYDIHGNLPALEAVLEDAEGHGASRFHLGGDYSAFGAWPLECIERLRELPDATWIRGNWERWQADPSAAPGSEMIQGAAEETIGALGDELVHDLAALPATLERDGTLYCHASPRSDLDAFSPRPDPEADDHLLAGVTARRVVFGHTHVQFRRTAANGIELVNPGSVGLPWDEDIRAAYALVDEDADRVWLHRVEYDVEEAAGALDAIAEPWATTTAARVRLGLFEV